jgi:hypothetical protein
MQKRERKTVLAVMVLCSVATVCVVLLRPGHPALHAVHTRKVGSPSESTISLDKKALTFYFASSFADPMTDSVRVESKRVVSMQLRKDMQIPVFETATFEYTLGAGTQFEYGLFSSGTSSPLAESDDRRFLAEVAADRVLQHFTLSGTDEN